MRALREDWGDVQDQEKGPLFEGLVFTLLRSYQSYRDGFDELYYWATPTSEVDFILKGDLGFCAIEAKSGAKLRREDLSGLRAISDLKKLRKRILVYPSATRQVTDEGVHIYGFIEFAHALFAGKIL